MKSERYFRIRLLIAKLLARRLIKALVASSDSNQSFSIQIPSPSRTITIAVVYRHVDGIGSTLYIIGCIYDRMTQIGPLTDYEWTLNTKQASFTKKSSSAPARDWL